MEEETHKEKTSTYVESSDSDAEEPNKLDQQITFTFSCEFKIKLCSEAEASKWVSDYNEVTKETMVYTCSKGHSGKHVVTKSMKCHHNKRSTSCRRKKLFQTKNIIELKPSA